MILVDTSIWIDLLVDPRRVPDAAARSSEFVTCGPIVQEVLQGLDVKRHESAGLRDSFLELPRLCDPLPIDLFVEGARIYAEGRGRGYTIRSGVDCLIAAIAIRSEIELWHRSALH